jgi:hypothetical protein
MRRFLPVLLLAAAGAALPAYASDYLLEIDHSVRGGQLTIVPHLAAPAGSRLRYEMTSTHEGGAGQSNSSQSGSVNVGDSGAATLSRLSVSVGPKDLYVVTVKVFDGATLVAQDVLRYPR